MTKTKLISIAKGAAIAATGAVLAYLGQYLAATDFGILTPALTALLSVGVNAIRKYQEKE